GTRHRLRPGANLESVALEFEPYRRSGELALLQTRRKLLGQSPERDFERPEVGNVVFERDFGRNALGFPLRADGASIQPLRQPEKARSFGTVATYQRA